MKRIIPIILFLLAGPALAGRDDRIDKAERLWQMDRMLTIRIQMSAGQWRMMQPEKASRLATAMAVVQRPTTRQALDAAAGIEADTPPVEGERRPPGLVGNQYAYVGATVTIDDQTMKNVGVRFKGQWSYTLAGSSPRRPLKLNFDYFEDGQDFQGIQSMSLGTNALDPSHLRETIGYACFREAGVAAPRTCLALVYLTVEGLYDNELLGLYTAAEEVNKDFLYNHFDTAKGLLIRPERTRNLAYFGEDWKEYSRYNIQSDATPFTAGRFMDFTRLINQAGDEEFCTGIEASLDADSFLRFLAVNVLIGNLDSVLVNGHNFYVYIHPKTGRIAFVPWDLHLAFGWHGQSLDEWAGLTIERPYRDNNRFLDRLMMVGWMRDAYREYLREFATGCFAPEKMLPRIDRLQEIVRKAEGIAKAQGRELPVSMPAGNTRPRADLKPFVTARTQSVLDQLAGRVQGDPVTGRPPPPKPVISVPKPTLSVKVPALPAPKPPQPAAVAPKPANPPPHKVAAPVVPAKVPQRPLPPNPLAQFLLSTTDVERDGKFGRDEVADAAKHLFIAHGWICRGPIDETSLAAAFDHVGRLLDAFPPSTDDNAAPDDPLRPRAALTWAKALMQRIDVHAKGQATLQDLLDAAARMFNEADTNQDGALTSPEISAFLDLLVPRQ